MQVFTLLLL